VWKLTIVFVCYKRIVFGGPTHTLETTHIVPNVEKCLIYNIGFRKWSCDGIIKECKESICRRSSHTRTSQSCPVIAHVHSVGKYFLLSSVQTAYIKRNLIVKSSVDNKANYSRAGTTVSFELHIHVELLWRRCCLCMLLKYHVGDSKECVKFWVF